MRSHRRPTHLRRHHPRDRHRLLPSGPSHKAADNLTPVGRGSGVDANQHPRHRHVPGGVRTRQQAVSDETSAATISRLAQRLTGMGRSQSMRATMAGNSAESHNALADLVGAEPQNPLVGRHPIIRAMEGDLAGKPAMQPEERNLLLREAATQSRAAATEAPAELGKLRHDIQLVTLEVLIEQFAAGLKGGHRSDEGYWQEFFVLNTFALQQLFAAPVALYRPQLHVRSGDALGRGARIADFMLINSITRSAHLVEIKTPAARLLGSPYRNIYPPNVELSGAVAQIQAQIESTRVELPTLIARTPELAPIENCVVRGAVLAGTAEPLNAEQAQSFMRYRDGLGTVNVITFDEVLARPQGLHRLLADPPDSSALS
ncbi:DUF4263 domain-containing protein [Kribbella pittospori]|uniref:DUF4263 domain-containing protein n=2 Tax=Kribbella pittospori TaxID=722689 RepID=A0A4V2MC48_9ACTN|nr:DUF4263 domain-containing protein [Kribbella pittospori]